MHACSRSAARERRSWSDGPLRQLTSAVLGPELDLHRAYATEWGVSTELAAERPTPTTRAYTNFLLRVATLGDYGELRAALLPCMWGYHELAVGLAERGRPAAELYACWIEEYAGTEFGELAVWCRELTDQAAATGDRRRMRDAFVTSSRYELAFWDASWHGKPPLPASDTQDWTRFGCGFGARADRIRRRRSCCPDRPSARSYRRGFVPRQPVRPIRES